MPSTTPPKPQPHRLTDPTSCSTLKPYIHTGRGGAGNVTRLPPPSTLSSASASKTSRPSHTEQVRAGRGGLGNIHRVPSEKRMFSFDEELALQLARSGARRLAPVYHVGRGGAGNTVRSGQGMEIERERVCIDGSTRRRESDSDSRSGSGSEKSKGSAPRNILRKIGRGVASTGDHFVG